MKPRMNTDAYYKAENPSQSGKDFSNILEARPLWSAQACLRLSRAGATPHEQRRQQAAALQRAQWTIVLLVAALLCGHLCFRHVSYAAPWNWWPVFLRGSVSLWPIKGYSPFTSYS